MEQIRKDKVGVKLRRLRGKKPISEVASAWGVTNQAIWQYETGKRMPSDSLKMVIAKYYGATVDEIFFNPMVHNS